MDYIIKNVFKTDMDARDIVVFQDSTKKSIIIRPDKEMTFTLLDKEDFITININAGIDPFPFKHDFRITYPLEISDQLVYSLGNDDIKVDYVEKNDLSILRFSAGIPEWQVLISDSVSSTDNQNEESTPTEGPATTVTVGEDDQ